MIREGLGLLRCNKCIQTRGFCKRKADFWITWIAKELSKPLKFIASMIEVMESTRIKRQDENRRGIRLIRQHLCSGTITIIVEELSLISEHLNNYLNVEDERTVSQGGNRKRKKTILNLTPIRQKVDDSWL